MTTDGLQAIHADSVYPVELFREITGLSEEAYAKARQRGLRTAKVGKRVFVVGSSWLEFCVNSEKYQHGDNAVVTGV